jgi:hypothetical protein
VAHLQGIEGLGMSGLVEALGSLWPPFAIRPWRRSSCKAFAKSIHVFLWRDREAASRPSINGSSLIYIPYISMRGKLLLFNMNKKRGIKGASVRFGICNGDSAENHCDIPIQQIPSRFPIYGEMSLDHF